MTFSFFEIYLFFHIKKFTYFIFLCVFFFRVIGGGRQNSIHRKTGVDVIIFFERFWFFSFFFLLLPPSHVCERERFRLFRETRPCEWRSLLTKRSRAESWCSNIHSFIDNRMVECLVTAYVRPRAEKNKKRETLPNFSDQLRKPSKAFARGKPNFSSAKHPRTLFLIKKFLLVFFNYSKSINNYDSNLSLLLLVFFSLGDFACTIRRRQKGRMIL